LSEQQTYKAKSTSIVVLLLLCLIGLGNKACKTINVPVRFRAEQMAVPPAEKKQTAAPVKLTSPRPSSAKKAVKTQVNLDILSDVSDPAHAVQEHQKAKASYRFRDSTASSRTYQLPHLQSVPDEQELNDLNERFTSGNILGRGTNSDSGRQWQKAAVENGKMLDNTGSSYFNAEVQPNMNDQLRSAFTTRLLYDSVISVSNKDFVYNTLTINNTTSGRLDIQVIISSPAGWQMVTTNLVNITLQPFGSTIIPMRFSPSNGNTSVWQQAKIEYRLNNVIDSRKSFFKMKVQEYAGFKAMLPNSNMVLTSYQKHVGLPVYVKNAGNTSGSYVVATNNQLLKLGTKVEIELAAGKDTTLYVPVSLSESQFSMLKKEDIKVTVTNSKGENINLIQALSRVGNILKDHSSAYLDMPLQLETGIMYSGTESPVQYYGALYGTLDFNDDNHLSMSMRSNTIAQGQTNQNSMLRFDFTGKHLQASAGNIQGVGEFMVDGYGVRLGYQWKSSNKAEVFGMLKSRVGDTRVFGAALHLGLSDNLRITDALSLSTDNIRMLNSGILSQVTELKIRTAKLSLITGIGAEQNNANLADGTQKTLSGTSLGYNFQWDNKHFAAVSNVMLNSNSYPGLFKGQRLQAHDLRWLKGASFLGAYYEYNFRKQNYWLDTMLMLDMFNLKTTNYGLKTGINLKGTNLVLAAGNQKQLQDGTENFQTSYNYINLNVSSLIAKKLFLNISSFGGVISGTGDGPKDKVFVTTTQGNLQYKTLGLSFRYDNGPYYYQEYAAYTDNHKKYERIIFSPFIETQLLKKSLSARLQGNYARTMPSDVSNTSILANINYSHPKGYDFNINGIVPVGGSNSNQTYVSATFRMKLKAPFIAVRKYYNLKLVLFKDQNSNGIRDAGEEPVIGQTLSLNGDLFVSDGTGVVLYKNTERGIYKADFGYSSKLKGWIPSQGTIQKFELVGNKSIDVPYKVSRVLSGKLLVQVDSFSNTPFNPSHIKVSATSDNGEIFSTLTDDNGEFYFNLPSGNYIISLSELAFSDQFRPVQFSQAADLMSNHVKTIYFEIKQKRRQINIKRK
jgi:hypothetical protein